MDIEFFRAPIELQVALAGGYIGYLAAYTGVRDHHKQIDVAFLTIVFGLIASVVYLACMQQRGSLVVAVGAAVIASAAVGILWRKVGRRFTRWLLKTGRVSFADDDPSVMSAIFSDTSHNVSQVMVALDDGREFMCEDTYRFRDAAIAPVLFGTDGSIALYVTRTYHRQADGTEVENVQESVRDPTWGDNLTIIPADRVRQIDVRFQRKKSPLTSS